jgi:hypothetical protein
MQKNDHLTIQQQDQSEDVFDINFLKKKGIAHLQELTGKNWTDYNIHDPGITTLEIVCFALTELGYRSDYEIEDLFQTSPKEAPVKDTFFPAHAVLSTGPITINDFRKVILDLEGIKNIELIASKTIKEFKGIYDAYIELNDTETSPADKNLRLKKIQLEIAKHRIVCFEIDQIYFLENDMLGIDLTVELNSKVDQTEFLYLIANELDHYFSPSPKYKNLEELQEQKLSTSTTFSGPLLKNGFITEEDIQGHKIRRQVYISDLVNLLMDIESISHIKKIKLKDSLNQSYNWLYDVAPEKVPRLNYENTIITATYKGKPSFSFRLSEILSGESNAKMLDGLGHKDNQLILPKGELKNLKEYRSISHDFPVVYGLSELGLPAGATEETEANAKQFKAFLLLFDQVLANYFAQLDHVKHLFSLNPITTTNAIQLLEDFPGIYFMHKPFLDYYVARHINLDDERHLKSEWKIYLESNRVEIEQIIQKTVEDEFSFMKRRNLILDHLLARFGYEHTSFEFVAQLTELELIDYKVNLLNKLLANGSNKSKGFDSNAQPLLMKSGFELNFYDLLGFKGGTTHLITAPTASLLNKKEESLVGNNGISFVFKNANQSLILEDLIALGRIEQNYIKDKIGFHIAKKESTPFVAATFQGTPEEKNKTIQQLVKKLNGLSSASEGIYAIEHLLLKPTAQMSAFGFAVYQKEIAIFSSPYNLSREDRDDLIETYITFAQERSTYSIIELEHNQFKIKWAKGEKELLSTHYFDSVKQAFKGIEDYIYYYSKLEQVNEVIKVGTKYTDFYNEIDDPFSNIITFVLPTWPHRFQNLAFKRYIEEVLIGETPAHIFTNICWLNYEEMLCFEKSYQNFMNTTDKKYAEQQQALEVLLPLLIMKQ